MFFKKLFLTINIFSVIHSRFSSNKNAMLIASFCLSILIKTNQSWKIVHHLLSLNEEIIIKIITEIGKTAKINRKNISYGNILFDAILKISNRDIQIAEQLLLDVFAKGWDIVLHGSEFYPSQWSDLKNQAPPLFFLKGRLNSHKNHKTGFAVVGTTQPTINCVEITKELVTFIVQSGGYIISGGARGIDQIGHNTAIRCGGTTQVILPCGILYYSIPHPWEEAIQNNRMQIISPWLPTAKWTSQQAVRRNLFIASLAEVGCILQPSHEGGSLRVARNILSRHLPVFVYKPKHYGKMLENLPAVLPLTNSDGRLNYSLLKNAISKVEFIKDEIIGDLFD